MDPAPRAESADDRALQTQARALGDPTRHELFRRLRDAPGPVDVATLTRHVGLHHNAVRQHLAKLVAAGLVVERTARPRGRGRPRLEYAVDPRSDARWGAIGPYERLAVLLAEIVRTGDSPEEVGRREGRRRARLAAEARAADPADEPVDALVDLMERMGFDPSVQRRGGTADLTLRRCPFASAVFTDPDTVCGLHLGLARGIAEEVGGFAVDELVVEDPRLAPCHVRCSTPTSTPTSAA